MPDFAYTPELLSQLREQIRAARSTGMPWLADNAQRAYDYAKANGANLPFDEAGNDLPGSPGLPPLPQPQQDNIAETLAAIRGADPAVFAAPPPAENRETVDQLITQGAADAYNSGPPPQPAPAAAPAHVPTLEEDPAYQAFVRALGNERTAAERTTNEGVDAANRSLSNRLPQIADAGAHTRELLSGGYESRGLLRSGQHEQALGRQRQVEANQTSTLTDDTAQRVAALHSGLAERMAGFDSRQAEQNLAASGRLQASQDAQRLAATEQQNMAALLAEQRRSNDALSSRYDTAIRNQGPGGITPPAPSGAVGILPLDPNDPDYLQRLIAQMSGH